MFNGFENSGILILILLWTLPWKGVALWRAAHRGEKKWFIAMLVLNTLAILEIIYIFVFSKRPARPAGEPA
jgi:methionyl-tRNA synthetase